MHADTLIAFLLALTRISGVFAFLPLPGLRNGPEPARIALAACLAAALYPLWKVPAGAAPGIGQIAVWMIAEACLGVGAGLACGMAVEGLLVAAQAAGLQAGYSYASTVDPTTEADSNILLVISQLMGGMLFFALGLDREVLRAFAATLHGAGSFRASTAAADAVVRLGAGMFTAGLRLALPIIGLLLLIDISFALLGRINAQLQLLTVAFPAKMLGALAVLAALTPVFVPVYRASAEAMLRVVGALNVRP